MSKLDEIVSYNENVPSERIKEEIKALFLELIAEVYNDPFDELSRVDLDNLRTKVDSL